MQFITIYDLFPLSCTADAVQWMVNEVSDSYTAYFYVSNCPLFIIKNYILYLPRISYFIILASTIGQVCEIKSIRVEFPSCE